MSATVPPSIETCATLPRKIHQKQQQPYQLSTDDPNNQVSKPPGRQQFYTREKRLQLSLSLTLQSSQPTNTPSKLESLKRRRIPSKAIRYPLPHSSAGTITDTDSQISSSTSSPLPLTQANLRSFNNTQMAPNPSTPGKSKTTSVSSRPHNQSGIRSLLENNNLYIDDDTFENYPKLQILVYSIIGRDRNSAVQPESCDAFRKARKSFPKENEATFLINLWACLLNKTREVEKLEVQDKIEWIKTAWDTDDLKLNWTVDFLHGSIPPVKTNDLLEKTLLEAMPKVANPKPDIAYGLAAEAFDETERMVNHTFYNYAVLSTNVYHIGFIVEGKGSDGSIEDAVTQCCRGGSAIVNARMKFNAEAATKELPQGADLQSIAFSLAVTVSHAEMYVHWAEIKESKTIFHMNYLEGYLLKDRKCEGFTRLRRDIDNVLDWMTLKRRQEIKGLCKAIAEKIAKPKAKKARQGPSTSTRKAKADAKEARRVSANNEGQVKAGAIETRRRSARKAEVNTVETQQAPTKKRKAGARREVAIQEPPGNKRKRGNREN